MTEYDSYDEFRLYEGKDKEKIIKYIELCYGKNSELIKKHSDIDQRKKVAGTMAGFDVLSAHFLQIYNLKNKPVLAMINCYLQKIQSSYTYERMISDMEAFSEFQRMMREPIEDIVLDADKKMKAVILKATLSEHSKKLEMSIKECMTVIFGNDEDLKKEQEPLKRITPQMMAKNVQ